MVRSLSNLKTHLPLNLGFCCSFLTKHIFALSDMAVITCLLVERFVLRHFSHLKKVFIGSVGRDSSGGIATGYVLDGPGIESRWGPRFSAPVQSGHGAHPASYTMGTDSHSPGGKAGGAWR
jgi:hypothetical protein